MNALEVIIQFFFIAQDDSRLASRHLTVFVALVLLRMKAVGDRFLLDRRELMRMARINSRDTYNRVLNDLHQFGYIRYEPSFAAGRSRVEILVCV